MRRNLLFNPGIFWFKHWCLRFFHTILPNSCPREKLKIYPVVDRTRNRCVRGSKSVFPTQQRIEASKENCKRKKRSRLLTLTPWVMEPECSTPHWQRPSNNPYPEPNQSNSLHWYLSLQGTPIFLHSGNMPCPSQSSRFNHPDYIRWTVQMMMILENMTAFNWLGCKITCQNLKNYKW